MSRAINLPSQSVKLTNVAIVRLTLHNKRFEIACYKNKVLDYRNGLETDLTEVLQTSNIHIFTNVTKGQFASSTDCITAFGPIKGKSQDDMAIHILLHGKSIQVSEIERQQLYDTTLLQIATHIATTCINPNTGIPYTTSQIKHALTTTNSSTTGIGISTDVAQTNHQTNDHSKKKGKKNSKKPNSHDASSTTVSSEANYQQHFVIQPHKPMKQQYLQAVKYLQYNHIIPIARASMELIWRYPTKYDPIVMQILQELHVVPIEIPTTTESDIHQQHHPVPLVENMSSLTINEVTTDATTTHEPIFTTVTTANETSTNTTTSESTMSRTMIVDPSLYRILQEYTSMNNESNYGNNRNDDDDDHRHKQQQQVTVPNSRIEILRQQVFQKQPPPSTTAAPSSQQQIMSKQPQQQVPQKHSIALAMTMDADGDDDDSNNDIDDDGDVDEEDAETNNKRQTTRRNHHQLQLLLNDDDNEDDDDDDDDVDDEDSNIGQSEKHDNLEVDEKDDDDFEGDDDDSPVQQSSGRSIKNHGKKKIKKKKHLQLVQSQMVDKQDEDTDVTTQVRSKNGNNNKSKTNLQQQDSNDGRKKYVDEAATSPTAIKSMDAASVNRNKINTTEKVLFTCNTCIGVENAFNTTAEYRAHYRSDWHRYNQKLKSCQAASISYSEFITCDAQSFFNNNKDDDF